MAPEPGRPGLTILFDKDGTLIEDVPFNVDPAQIRLVPGGGVAIRRLARAGCAAAIVTNQSGVARGLFRLVDLEPVRERIAELLAAEGMPLRGFFACPHLPMGVVPEFAVACDCRKPGPGLIRQAVDELDLDPAETWLVGDSWADIGAGRKAGCRTALVGPEWRLAPFLPPGREPEISVPDLASAVDAILADRRRGSVSDPGSGLPAPRGVPTAAGLRSGAGW